ncbi:hypothetical protein [Absidia glauca]|uniref:Helicase C-terminal domain-containing protein n=1 Tax=Absidia glauca TaxID=4829 RepID=A0A163MTW9_ABSGL|nr:hypothetical protein [Absidia glauca]
MRQELEQLFLTPQQSFPPSWLNKCQEHWDEEPSFFSFAHEQLAKSRTDLQVVRQGYDGDLIGYQEAVQDDANLMATNSTSLTRAFGSTKDFVRGKASQFPFAPGGLEVAAMVDTTVDDGTQDNVEFNLDLTFLDDLETTCIAPGLDRGLRFDEEQQEDYASLKQASTSIFSIEDMLKPGATSFDFLEIKATEEETEPATKKATETQTADVQDVDSLLPIHTPQPQPEGGSSKKLKSVKDTLKRRDWAHEINVNQPFDNFHEMVPELAQHYPFELDTFQKHAVYHLEMGDSVFVAAHTSAGKTVVADYAIALASKHMTKAIYTSPIKALSNQKFRDFKHTFGDDVGILTGDVQIRPEASCLPVQTDLCSSLEKSEIHVFIERSLVRLRGTDKELPQILRMRDLLSRGIAVHHGGLLPIIKEIVEILFARGLVKVLFATETFAMGVNMPARSVVFSGLRKNDGRGFRDLLPGEYTQMSGRAGRRGLDSTGMVVIACSGDEPPSAASLSTMLLGKPTKLESQFRLTYNMILNLLRVEALKVEEMIKRSFSENSNQRLLPDTQRLMDENELKRSALQQVDCTICSPDLSSFYDVCSQVIQLSRAMILQFITKSAVGNRALCTGRLVIINNSIYRNVPAVILRSIPGGANASSQQKSFCCLVLVPKDTNGNAIKAEDEAPLPITSISAPSHDNSKVETVTIGAGDIILVTKNILKAKMKWKWRALSKNWSEVSEFDWQKIKDIEFQEMLKTKANLTRRLRTEFQCTKCPDLNDHYALMHAHKHLTGQIDMLKVTISDQNLELLPDYQQRIQVLQQLNYIDDQGTVQLKGRVACEINSADELLLTELVLDNVFADFEPAEVVALLSAFVFQERNASEPRLTPRLTKGKEIILTYARKVAQIQADCGLQISVEDYVNGLKFGLVEVVYEWARGLPFKHITDLTDVLEGSIVRCISRLDETCREVMGAARMVGDTSLYKKMEQAEEDIKRDIVFAASLTLWHQDWMGMWLDQELDARDYEKPDRFPRQCVSDTLHLLAKPMCAIPLLFLGKTYT